jgi:hypothetical protein
MTVEEKTYDVRRRRDRDPPVLVTLSRQDFDDVRLVAQESREYAEQPEANEAGVAGGR